ncbi:MAG: hypothetical protein ACNS60_15925 [Candidatus Cyclobacteriaceae bacterium M2_1C_046]
MKKLFFLSIVILYSTNFGYSQYLKIEDIIENKAVNGVADINSTLRIHLEKDSIRDAMAAMISQKPKTTNELKKINNLLQNQIQVLELINKSINNYKSSSLEEDLKLLNLLSGMLETFYIGILEDPVLREEANIATSEYYDKLDAGLIPEERSVDLYVIRHFSRKAERLKTELEKLLNESKIRFRLGAFIASQNQIRPVHVENFDEYALGEYYEVERFIYALTPENREELKRYTELAGQLNELYNETSVKLDHLLSKVFSSPECIRKTDSLIQIFRTNLETDIQNDYSEIKATLKVISNYSRQLLTNFVTVQQLNLTTTPLGQFDSKLNTLITNLPLYKDSLDGVLQDLKIKLQRNTNLINDISQIGTHLSSCQDSIKNDIRRLKTISALVTETLIPFRTMNQQIGELSDEVRSFKYEDLPDEGVINLKYTGKRTDGDLLIIKAVLQKQEDKNVIRKQLAYKEIYLRRLGFHSDLKVAMLFADPFNQSEFVDLKRRFQFVPSYSILFKWGSKSKNWNKYFDFGIGINIATPDFDLDGMPEIATGITGSFMRDIIHAGLSFNYSADTPFWFVGFSLPLGSGNLPFTKGASDNGLVDIQLD